MNAVRTVFDPNLNAPFWPAIFLYAVNAAPREQPSMHIFTLKKYSVDPTGLFESPPQQQGCKWSVIP